MDFLYKKYNALPINNPRIGTFGTLSNDRPIINKAMEIPYIICSLVLVGDVLGSTIIADPIKAMVIIKDK